MLEMRVVSTHYVGVGNLYGTGTYGDMTYGASYDVVDVLVPPVELLQYKPKDSSFAKDGVIEDALRVSYCDAASGIRVWEKALRRAREWGRQYNANSGHVRVMLQIRDTNRHATWDDGFETPLYDGSVAMEDGFGRKLTINIKRGPYWESIRWYPVALSRSQLNNYLEPQDGNYNYTRVLGKTWNGETLPIEGDVPARTKIDVQVTSATTSAPFAVNSVYIGWGQEPPVVYEAEDADQAGGIINAGIGEPTFSNGRGLQWNGADWTAITLTRRGFYSLFLHGIFTKKTDTLTGRQYWPWWMATLGMTYFTAATGKVKPDVASEATTSITQTLSLGMVKLSGKPLNNIRAESRYCTACTGDAEKLDYLLLMPAEQLVQYDGAVDHIIDDGVQACGYEHIDQGLLGNAEEEVQLNRVGKPLELWPIHLMPQQYLTLSLNKSFWTGAFRFGVTLSLWVKERYEVMP